MTLIQVAIHSAKNSDRVIEFINLGKFTSDFQKLHSDGNIYGCFYDENGKIVAQDIWDDIHENVLIS